MENFTQRFIFRFLFLLCLVFLFKIIPTFWRDYPQYFPERYTQYRLKELAKDNNRLIDDILLICEEAKIRDNPVYCLDALAEYGAWFEKYKRLIKETPELKELVITKLKEAVRKASPEDDFNAYLNAYLKEMKPNLEADAFNEYLKKLSQ